MPLVLHVITGLAVGGAEMALYRLITGSRGGDYTHAVVTLTPDGAMRKRFHEAGIELVIFNFNVSPVSQFFSLISLMRKIRPDIVQTWLYHADLLGGLAASLAGIRSVIWGVHSTNLVGSGASGTTRIARRLCAWVSRVVPHTIVCVAEASKRAHTAVGYDAKRMVVVPNGFELSQLAATGEQRALLRSQCGIGEDEVVIGSLGRFNPAKDPHNFVRAAEVLARRSPHVRFLMVGRGLDDDNAELASWIAHADCRDRFVLLGERADVPACLAAMDIFCLHSRTEAFPLVLGEAMAMGLPCVVTDVGDAPLMLADAGVVVPKEDSASLARELQRLVAMEPETRRRLGQKAKARIQAEFTLEQSRRQLEAIYLRVTKESRR